MEKLSDLFTIRGALADTNSDGVPDDIALRFVLPDPLSAEEWCALADLTAVLGLHVTGFSPPLVVEQWDGPSLTITHDAALDAGLGRATLADNRLTVTGADGTAVAAMLRALANGPLPDISEWSVTVAQYPMILVRESKIKWTHITPTREDLFMQEGDTLGHSGFFADSDSDRIPDDTRSTIYMLRSITQEIGSALLEFGARLGIETTGLTLPLFVSDYQGAIGELPVYIGTNAEYPPAGGVEALPHREHYGAEVRIGGQTDDETAVVLRAFAREQTPVEPFIARAEPQPKETVLWSHEWQGRTERELLLEAVRGHLPSTEDGPCSVHAQISEPASIRAALRDELRAMLPDGSDVTVLPVHHAGRSWLTEVVAPAANVLPGLASLDVRCKPFVPEREPCLDMRIRWLQECWPADELIAPFLVLPLEAVRISLGDEDQEPIYLAQARNEAGDVLGEWTFDPSYVALPYLPVVPDTEWVHVCTSSAKIRHGNPELFGGQWFDLGTDLDMFWTYCWQFKVLPAVREYILSLNDGKPTASSQPFFDELRVEVWVSEPEYALGVREERESPAEGLAEDIYFNALDYIAALGIEVTGEAWEEPGQVVPLVHVAPGEPPRAVVSLIRYERADETPAPVPVETRTQGVAMDEVVTGANLPGLLAYLDRFDAVTVRGVGTSYQGRPIAAIEVVKPDSATVRSRAKLAAMKPTHLIVARHHANEVASTTAALTLVEGLATDPALAPLLDRLNVIVIPDENPDGTALHARLMAEHPTWKHHAARYNAVGVEFSSRFNDPETPYGEAKVRPLLWRQWRPDVITDNHGVPSHEWWQPFAGGTNPRRFRISYWLCQALVYGICRYAPDEAHTAFATALRDTVSAAIAAEPDLAAANRVYAERYTRWGHQYLPESFPATYHGDMFWFFSEGQIPDDAPPREIALREPQMLSASWVTEVLDETAQGAHLALVAKAHLTANLALLRATAAQVPPVSFTVEPLAEGRHRHRLHRLRPLIIGNGEI